MTQSTASPRSASMKALVDELVKLLDARARIGTDPEMLEVSLPKLRPPATAAQLHELEKKLKIRLPASYREFLLVSNGLENFAGTHLVLGSQDHGRKIKSAVDDITEFWEDEEGEPIEVGVPLAVPDADMGIRNLWAFAADADGNERAVIDWDNGGALREHRTFRAFLESAIDLEKRLAKKSAPKKKGAKKAPAKAKTRAKKAAKSPRRRTS